MDAEPSMRHKDVTFLILKAGVRKIGPARSEKASAGAFFKVKSLCLLFFRASKESNAPKGETRIIRQQKSSNNSTTSKEVSATPLLGYDPSDLQPTNYFSIRPGRGEAWMPSQCLHPALAQHHRPADITERPATPYGAGEH
uniref:hypothetical protein n=1 Tax=Marinobacterium profundum TaxID=1714300 RepID=UPI00082BEEF3|nr:hypothetical protein [Marinobacterium profundum]